MFNQITLIGNLGEDAKVQADGKLLRLRMATSLSYKKGDQWITDTEWHTVKQWTDQAQYKAERLPKGSKVFVQGAIYSEEYQGQKQVYIKAYFIKNLSSNSQPQTQTQGTGW